MATVTPPAIYIRFPFSNLTALLVHSLPLLQDFPGKELWLGSMIGANKSTAAGDLLALPIIAIHHVYCAPGESGWTKKALEEHPEWGVRK